ncbi:MAG: cupredoxin domain-containing protein [Deltaproteobacteria bacterium]|nr:cupredoxin domain-containing protein [Deltaproteobacteria bacterium]
MMWSGMGKLRGPAQSRRATAGRALGWTLAALLLAGVVACAVAPVPGAPVVDGNGVRHLEIQANNYAFTPNVIRTPSKQALALSIVNPTTARHNFTIETADGRLVLARDLQPGNQTEFTPPVPGKYFLYCDRLGHRARRMSGEIDAY